MRHKYISRSEEDTIILAENLESEKLSKMLICLKGDLGTGKTLFAKSFANAMGIKEAVTSPTFNIIKEYLCGQLPLYHMDVYRLEGDIDDLGIEEYFTKKGVTIIEWADMIEDRLPKNRLDITINPISEDVRVFVIEPHGTKYEELCEKAL